MSLLNTKITNERHTFIYTFVPMLNHNVTKESLFLYSFSLYLCTYVKSQRYKSRSITVFCSGHLCTYVKSQRYKSRSITVFCSGHLCTYVKSQRYKRFSFRTSGTAFLCTYVKSQRYKRSKFFHSIRFT